MKGFTIKCNDCGREIIREETFLTDERHSGDIRLKDEYHHIQITCVCGNQSMEDEIF